MRYLPHTKRERELMMAKIGIKNINELFDKIPKTALSSFANTLPAHTGELEVTHHLQNLANLNLAASDAPSFLGGGAYRHHIPATVDSLIQRGEFLTSYTPYQPEVSQGRLEALLNFQQMIIDLTGMEIANASLLDEATAAAEAMTFCKRVSRSKSMRFFVAVDCHPQTIDVLKTRAEPMGIELVVGNICLLYTSPSPRDRG